MKNFESISSEITVKNVKWFILSVYRSPNQNNIKDFFFELNQLLNLVTSRYENIVVMGDMNIDIEDSNAIGYQDLREFMCTFDLTNLIKEKTCIAGDTSHRWTLFYPTNPVHILIHLLSS